MRLGTQVLLICTVKQATHRTARGCVRMWVLTGQAELSRTATKKGSSPTFPSSQPHFSKHSHVPCTDSPVAFSTLLNSRVSVCNASTDIQIRTVVGKFECKISAAHCTIRSGKLWRYGSKIW